MFFYITLTYQNKVKQFSTFFKILARLIDLIVLKMSGGNFFYSENLNWFEKSVSSALIAPTVYHDGENTTHIKTFTIVMVSY